MRIYLVAVGKRMPAWVNEAYTEFCKRMPRELGVYLIDVEAAKRRKTANPDTMKEEEADNILRAIPNNTLKVMLDPSGKAWSTGNLSQQMANWMQRGSDVALIVGGADGLAKRCLQEADVIWSLSSLTFPHALVRVIVAEQLYRAWTILQGHPYHRS